MLSSSILLATLSISQNTSAHSPVRPLVRPVTAAAPWKIPGCDAVLGNFQALILGSSL